MRVFKSLEDVEAAGLSPPVHGVVLRVVQDIINAYAEYGEKYDAEEVGYTILVEEGDTEAAIAAEVGYGLREALFEGGSFDDGVFLNVTLHSNEWGITWVIPDGPWLDPEIRAKLVEECGGEVTR